MKKSVFLIAVLALALNTYAQQVFTVTKTTDPNPFDHPFNNVDSLCDPEMYGTLQWAINKANKASGESAIEFNIPGAGPHEIALSYYLPQIKNKVTIDGTSQPGYQTGHPSITIRGHIKLKSCFDAYSVVTIQGLHITDFSSHGIIITNGEAAQIKDNIITNIHNEVSSLPGIGIRLVSSYHCVVQGNQIGTGGNSQEPMQVDNYGIYLQKSSYCTIGDTTENLKNTITNCDLGVLVEGGIRNKLSGNSIYDNHKAGILLSNGGNNNIPTPGITEYVDGMLKGTSQPGYTIEIFGSTGNENANHYLGTTTANDYGEWYLNITTNYPYYIATATDHENNTSKLSGVVENPAQTQTGLNCNQAIEAQTTEAYISQSFQMQDTIIWLNFAATTENMQIFLNTSSKSNQAKITSLELFEGDCNNLNLMAEIDDSHRILGNLIPGNSYKLKISSDNIADFDLCLSSNVNYPTTWSGRIYFKIENNSMIEIPQYSGGTYCCNNDMTNLIEKYNISKIYKPFDKLNSIELHKTYQVEFYALDSVNALINDLQNLEYVEYAERIPIDKIMVATPDDYTYGNQWNLDIINAADAWGELDVSQIQNEVIIAIVDNEIRTTHEDLIGNLWVNDNEISGNNDNDNNGYIDDINGFDVADMDPSTLPPNTDFNHGTHVAGIAASTTDNINTEIASISWGAKIMAIKATHDASAPNTIDNGWAGVEYAIQNGADIINMSWGYNDGPFIQTHQNIINTGHNMGIIFVAAAGNEGQDLEDLPTYPALYDNVITVGSTGTTTTGNDIISTFSNYGTDIDVMAPGYEIYSTYSDTDDSYDFLQGTSMASPLVAGLCGLMLKFDPNLTPGAVQNCLTSTCDDIYDVNTDPEYDGKLGSGRINAYEAIKCLQTPPIPDFNSDLQIVCTDQTVHLYDNSTGAPMTYWTWSFEPNTVACANPNAQNPEVQFLSAGNYTITLEVSNSLGTDEITKDNYIIVNECNPIFSSQGNWYFGYNAAVSFAGGMAVSTQPSSINSSEGCASISDDSGNLLFYTNGQKAWNSNHDQMMGQTGIMDGCGSDNECSAAQGTIIVPDPGNPMQYYIFYVPKVEMDLHFGLEYSIIDMEQNNGLGDIISINQTVPNNHDVTEHLSAIPHCNGVDYWIVVHTAEQNDNNHLLAYKLTPNGIDPPVSSLSFPVNFPNQSNDWIGQIDIAPNGETVAITEITKSDIYIYNFDREDGTFTPLTTLDGHNSIYGTSFSPNSQLLYFTKSTNLIQYDLSDITSPSSFVLEDVYGLAPYSTPQLGPDNRIYISVNSDDFLSVVNNPNEVNTVNNPNNCNFVYNGVQLTQLPGNPTPVCRLGLPNMIDAVVPNPIEPNFDYTIINCNTVDFQSFPCGNDYEWDFGDGYTLSGNGEGDIPVGTNDGTTSGSYMYPSHTYSENGIYEVTLTIGGNSNTESVIVGVNVYTSVTNVCGQCNGTATATITGGTGIFDYEWNTSPVQTTQTATNLCGGTYTVTVTDANNCTAGASAVVLGSTIDVEVSIIDPLCNGDCNGSITVNASGGTSPYEYDIGNGYQTENIFDNLCADNYTITVQDDNGCTATADATVNEPPQLIATIESSTISCFESNNGSATVSASGGTGSYTYLWSDGQTTQTANNLEDETYNVTVFDGNLCEAYASVTINENPEVTASAVVDANVTCFGGSDGQATVTPGGGTGSYTYLWSDGQETATAIDLIAGTYDVTVYDDHQCAGHTSVIITEPEELIITENHVNVDCYGNSTGEIEVTATGGTSPYTYTLDGSTTQDNGLFTGLIAENYTLEVTDNNGCTDNVTIDITQPTELIANAGDDETACGSYSGRLGDIINGTATGGTEPYGYEWSHQEYLDDNSLETPLASIDETGVYTFTVTVTDENNCTATDEVTITVYDIPTVTAGSNSPICVGEDINLSATCVDDDDDASFEWSGPNSFASPEQNPTITSATIDANGTYTVTVTDVNGCTASEEVTLEVIDDSPTTSFSISGCPVIDSPLPIINTSADANSYQWYINNNEFSNELEPEMVLEEPGYHCIKLVATNECGSDTYTSVIYVNSESCACSESEGGYFIYDYTDGHTINNDETWSSEETIYAEGNIYIEDGATLTIGENQRVEFAPNGRLIVEPGGKLILEDNVVLTGLYLAPWGEGKVIPGCPNMWQGIEVWGDNDNVYYEDAQGILKILNQDNVKIEHAHIGILSGARNMDYICDPVSNPFDDEPGSGLVRIGGGNTAFYNNGIGIKFLERDPIIYSGLTWSGNILYDCNFNSDELRDYHYSTTSANSYPNEQNPWAGYANSSRRTDAGIHIEGIYRMSIRHCEFDNNQHGILSFDSKYDVFDCDFTNAHFGIKINNVNSGVDFNHEISRCYFDRIPGYEPPSPPYYFKLFTSAIYIRAGKNDYIHDNDFGHIETDQELNQYGIFTNSTSSFRITENVFRKFKHGIKISNSGDDGGFVGAEETTYSYWEGNRFNAAWRSITTGGDNSKLKLKCNVCDNNLALYQPELYDVNYKNYGNLADQGLPSSPYSLWNYKKPAGNEFYPENEPDYKTLWSNYPYTYYRHAGPPEVIPYEADVSDPINIFSNNVEKPEENNIACSPIYYPTPIEIPSLPFTYSTNPGYMSPPYNLLDSLSYQKDSLQLILETVNSNLDNGKTFELLSDIHGNAPQGKLKNMLIVNSPLSDTVIHALLTEYPLAHGNFKNVMEYNLPVRKHLRSLLYTVLDQIPQGIAQQLYVLQANNPSFNTPGQLEHEINSVTIERQMLLNHLLILLNDTVHNRREDAIFLLENEESLSAEKTLISTHIADGDYDLAASKLNALPTGDPDNADFVSLHQMLLSNYEQGNTLYQLDSSEIELIQTLAYQCPVNLASANAQSILYYLFREVVPECPAQMGTKNMPLAEEHPVITGAKTDNPALEDNYPDPATIYTIMPYYLPEGSRGKIEIRDLQGRLLSSYKLNSGKNQVYADTKNMYPGVYLYSLNINGVTYITKKFVVQ